MLDRLEQAGQLVLRYNTEKRDTEKRDGNPNGAQRDVAGLCDATGRVLSRHTGYDANLTRTVLEACAQACKTCGDECASHAGMHEHCRVCAEACRRCEQACRELLASLT